MLQGCAPSWWEWNNFRETSPSKFLFILAGGGESSMGGDTAHGGRWHSHRHPQEGLSWWAQRLQAQVMDAPTITEGTIPSGLRVGQRPGHDQPQLFLLGVPRAILGLPVEGSGQPLPVSDRGTGAQLSHHVLQSGEDAGASVAPAHPGCPGKALELPQKSKISPTSLHDSIRAGRASKLGPAALRPSSCSMQRGVELQHQAQQS